MYGNVGYMVLNDIAFEEMVVYGKGEQRNESIFAEFGAGDLLERIKIEFTNINPGLFHKRMHIVQGKGGVYRIAVTGYDEKKDEEQQVPVFFCKPGIVPCLVQL